MTEKGNDLRTYTPDEFEDLARKYAQTQFLNFPEERRAYFYYKNDEEILSSLRESFYTLMAGKCRIVPTPRAQARGLGEPFPH